MNPIISLAFRGCEAQPGLMLIIKLRNRNRPVSYRYMYISRDNSDDKNTQRTKYDSNIGASTDTVLHDELEVRVLSTDK